LFVHVLVDVGNCLGDLREVLWRNFHLRVFVNFRLNLFLQLLHQNLRRIGGQLLVDELHRVADGLDVLSGVIRDFDVEFFFEGHDQFDVVERVGAQVVDEGSLLGDLVRIGVQVVDHDLADAFEGVGHECLSACLKSP
jgi:hypothetical protein